MSRKDLAFPTKIRLLDAAVDVFSERGFENGFIREIVDRADANIAAINYHYGSKDQLAEAVLDFALSGVVAPEPHPEADPAERLRLLVGDLLEPDAATRRTGILLVRLLAWQIVRRAPLISRLFASAEWSVFARTRSVVEALRPDLPPEDTALVAWSLIGQLVALRLVQTLVGNGSMVETARPGPALYPRALALAEATVTAAKPSQAAAGPPP